jgi:hypothetical protein
MVSVTSNPRGPQLKSKTSVISSKLFTVFLLTGLIAFIEAPVFAQSFASPATYTVGTSPYDGALGDFNGDGKADLVVANNSTSNISVLLGNGNGTFGTKTDYNVGQPAYGVVVTDLNSDGKLDVVAETAFSSTEGVSVLIGNGNGTFQTRVDYLFSGLAQPKSIQASDFNNDTKPDIVVINGSGATVFLGNGDGTLQSPVSYGSSDFATSVAVGDFNADAKMDLAVSSYGFGPNGVVSVMLGKGDGTFLPAVNYSSAPSPFSIVKGDFNSDSKLDLATVNIQVDSVSILLGNGDGTFGSTVNYPAGGFPYELSTGDLNSDGKSDLVIAGNGGGLSILKGNGDGTFQKSVNFVGGNAFATVLDLNGDTKPDIISAQTATSVAVFLNQTGPHNISGAVRDNNNVPLSDTTVMLTGGTPVVIKTDATGAFAFNDLASGQPYTVTPSKPNYTFTPPNQTFNNLTSNVTANFTGTLNHYSILGSVKDTLGVAMSGVTVTLSGSMTGTITTGADGSYAFTDLAGGGNYTVTPSLMKFIFTPPSATFNNLSGNRVVNFTGREATFTISGAVLNVDNGSNISGFNIELTGTRTGTTVTTSIGYSFSGLPLDGNYTVTASLPNRLFTNFNLLPPTSHSFNALSSNVTTNFSAKRLGFGTGNLNPLGIASGDLNGDGKLDVAVATTTGSNIHVLLGNGDGTLQTQVAYAADANPADVVIADFDGDGKADVASANIFGSDVSVFIGNGDGTLKTRVNFPVGSQPANLSVSDFNNDGKIDLAALGGPNTLSILLGNGNGTFQPAINRTIATAVFSVLPGDLNGDGKPDLVVLGFPGSVLVLLGRGDGTFADPVSYPAANEVVKATLADLNSDGKLDVAVASRLPNVLTVLLGRGDGTFQTGTTTSISAPADLISEDFDRDGKPDLVVALESGGFAFLGGNGDGTFSPAVGFAAGSSSGSLVAGDFNNDGKLDFALNSQGNSEVNILLNSSTAPVLAPTIFIEQGTTKAAALDSVTQLRGPFSILNAHNFTADHHTRVMLFTSNLGLSQPDAAILSVRANGILLTVEKVGPVSGVQGLDASYIVVRLPDGLPSGNLPLTVTLRGVVSSNTPTLEISP